MLGVIDRESLCLDVDLAMVVGHEAAPKSGTVFVGKLVTSEDERMFGLDEVAWTKLTGWRALECIAGFVSGLLGASDY